MTPKEKAKELREKFTEAIPKKRERIWGKEVILGPDWHRGAKLAIICVDEIDQLIQKSTPKDDPYSNLNSLEYWQEVKTELNNLSL